MSTSQSYERENGRKNEENGGEYQSETKEKLEEPQYQPLEQSDVKEIIHDVLNELQSRQRTNDEK